MVEACHEKNYKSPFFILMLIGTMVVISIAAFAVVRANAQRQITANMAENLEQRGVPVKYVDLISQIPLEIEIALQSTSADKHLAMEDNWFMTLARREAMFAYRTGFRLNNFKLIVFNAKGEQIFSEQQFIYPQDLNQQLIIPQQPKIDASKAKDLIKDGLQFSDLSLEKIDIVPKTTDKGSNQVLILSVSTESVETANKSLPEFLGSLFSILENGNKELGTNIVLCHLQVAENEGQVLLDFVRDVEAGSSQWKAKKGIYSSWVPQPLDPNAAHLTPVPISTPVPYPFPATERLQETVNTQQNSVPYP